MMCILNWLFDMLQKNAEWLCAIAIAYFAYKQYAITKLQIEQDLRMQRLELAQQLDEICKNFPVDVKEANDIVSWCLSHSSKFMFLLNEKEGKVFTEFINFIWDMRLKYTNKIPFNQMDAAKQFTDFQQHIDLALGNAKYGLTEIKSNKIKKKS